MAMVFNEPTPLSKALQRCRREQKRQHTKRSRVNGTVLHPIRLCLLKTITDAMLENCSVWNILADSKSRQIDLKASWPSRDMNASEITERAADEAQHRSRNCAKRHSMSDRFAGI